MVLPKEAPWSFEKCDSWSNAIGATTRKASELEVRRTIPCLCGVNIVVDRETIGIVGKSLLAVHRTLAKLRR